MSTPIHHLFPMSTPQSFRLNQSRFQSKSILNPIGRHTIPTKFNFLFSFTNNFRYKPTSTFNYAYRISNCSPIDSKSTIEHQSFDYQLTKIKMNSHRHQKPSNIDYQFPNHFPNLHSLTPSSSQVHINI